MMMIIIVLIIVIIIVTISSIVIIIIISSSSSSSIICIYVQGCDRLFWAKQPEAFQWVGRSAAAEGPTNKMQDWQKYS